MSAKLMCPRCAAFRTPGEVDFEQPPVRCKECGTPIEVLDERLEALDRHLATAGRPPEMMEPYPSRPIYPRAETQVTDSDSQTLLTRMLQFLLGTRETISRSAVSGMVSSLFMSVFVGVIAQFDLFIPNTERLVFDLTGWPSMICGLLLLAVFVGRPIGWLFIRPIASILRITYPELDSKKVWISSTVLTWFVLAVPALYPYQQLPPLLQGGLLTALAVGAAIAGVIGGFMGAIVPIGAGPKEYVQYLAVGGTVTGSLLVGSETVISLTLSSADRPFNGSGNIVMFCFLLAVASFLSMFPYLLVVLLSVGASKLIQFGKEFHLAYVLISGIVWAAIGYLGGGSLFMDVTSINAVVQSVIMGLCGACGGWAVGEFREDACLAIL